MSSEFTVKLKLSTITILRRLLCIYFVNTLEFWIASLGIVAKIRYDCESLQEYLLLIINYIVIAYLRRLFFILSVAQLVWNNPFLPLSTMLHAILEKVETTFIILDIMLGFITLCHLIYKTPVIYKD